LSADALGWHDEHGLDHRRRLRNGALVSLTVHGLVFATLVVSPPQSAPPMPKSFAVELVAAPSAARSQPAPKAASKPAPEPATAPEPAPPPPPPPPKAPVQVLPENSPQKLREVKPEPKPVKQVEQPPKQKPEPRPARPPREKALSYEDAMAALDDELGPEENPDLLKAPSTPDSSSVESSGEPTARAGVVVSAELAAWGEATTRLIQSKWVTPASFRGRGLVTSLELELSATGHVIGTPRVRRSSGDPFFDDNAVRAVLMANPLPPPPRAGVTSFDFHSEAN
jgi:colicin import membrane protein